MTENEIVPKKRDHLPLIFSILALLGVIIMILMEVFEGKDVQDIKSGHGLPEITTGANSIVFVNTDELLKKYELVNELTAQLEEERKRKDDDFTAKQKAYEDDAAYFQTQVQKQSISEQSAQQIYEKLMLQQQDLYRLQDQYTSDLAKKEYEMNMILLDSVKNYLGRLNKIHDFDYVLSSNNAGNILMARDTFDITLQVLDGLNREYEEKNKPEK